jgi:hypothetical protein
MRTRNNERAQAQVREAIGRALRQYYEVPSESPVRIWELLRCFADERSDSEPTSGGQPS